MSLENFKPEVFSTTCLTQRDIKTVALPLCDRSFEGDFKQGSRVHIPGVGSPTTHDLIMSGANRGMFVDGSGNKITAEDIEDEGAEFTIDQGKFILFKTNEIDELQQSQDAATRFMANNSNNMVIEQDSYVYKLIKAGAGATFTGTSLNSQNAYGIFCDAIATLFANQSALTPNDITIEVHPYIANVIRKALQYHSTPNDLSNGNTGIVVNGVTVYQSNNTITTDSSGTQLTSIPTISAAISGANVFHGVIRTRRSIVFAEPKVMTWKSYDLAGDGVGTGMKAWYYYGGKVLYPNETVDLSLTLGAEVNI